MNRTLLKIAIPIVLLVLACMTIKENVYQQPFLIPVGLGLFSLTFFYLAIQYASVQSFFRIAGFILLMTTATTGYSNWLPQVEGAKPPPEFQLDAYSMSAQQLADIGETIIFGGIGKSRVQGSIGKGQCPLCHLFRPGELAYRAPNLWGITARKRLKSTSIEYIAESHVCPSCYVVGGFGLRGTENRESPMPKIHRAPISLTLEEFIAVDTWLFFREGEQPPSPYDIAEAYRKIVPSSELTRQPKEEPILRIASKTVVQGDETLGQLFSKARCSVCHRIPGISLSFGEIGPPLLRKSMRTERLNDPTYTGSAQSVEEYITESILQPDTYLVPGYTDLMPHHYSEQLTAQALQRMVQHLSTGREYDPAID